VVPIEVVGEPVLIPCLLATRSSSEDVHNAHGAAAEIQLNCTTASKLEEFLSQQYFDRRLLADFPSFIWLLATLTCGNFDPVATLTSSNFDP
jgi:hypothetical protein